MARTGRGNGLARLRRADSAVSEVLGSILLVGLAVGLGAVFIAALFAAPGPAPSSHASLKAYVLPSDPTKLVIEHRGGPAIALAGMRVAVTLDGNVTDYLVASGAPWNVTTASGALRPASQGFSTGDRAIFTDASLPGRAARVQVVDGARGVLVLSPSDVQRADATKPALLAARMTSSTGLLLTFSERLGAASPADFRVGGVAPVSITLLGDGTTAELVVPATADRTPTVATVASPTGTWDAARNLLAGGASLPTSDALRPVFLVDPRPLANGTTTTTIGWTTDEASDSVVRYGATPALGLTTTVTNQTTGHVVPLSGLTPQTTYFYSVSSTDAGGNTLSSDVRTFTTRPAASGALGAESPLFISTLFPSSLARAKPALLGINILNPGATPMTIDFVRVTASPSPSMAAATLFEGALTSGAASDPEFATAACGWTQSGTNPSRATCDPGAPVTLPAYGMRQLLLNFTTPSLSAGGEWIITVDVGFVGPVRVVTSSHSLNVHFTAGQTQFTGGGPADMVGIYGLSGQNGNETAGATVSGGGPSQFWWKWTLTNGASNIRTRLTIPPGWTNVSLPHQAETPNVAVAVRQPTATTPGYVDIAQQADNRQLYFVATPPAGAGLQVIDIDMTGTDPEITSLFSFGVKVT